MIDEERAELCGAIIGDGWIEKREMGFFLAGNPTEDKEYYDSHITQIIEDVLNVKTKPKSFPYWGVYGVSLYKKCYIEALLNLGLPKGRKVYNASIPDWIQNSGEDIFFSFFRGLFDTDGCIQFDKDFTKYANEFTSKYHCKARARITSVSPVLMNQVFDLLTRNGIICTKRIRPGGFRNNRNNNDSYVVEINRKDAIRWLFEDVVPSNTKHTTKYMVWKKFGFCPPGTTIAERWEMLKNQVSPYSFYKRG